MQHEFLLRTITVRGTPDNAAGATPGIAHKLFNLLPEILRRDSFLSPPRHVAAPRLRPIIRHARPRFPISSRPVCRFGRQARPAAQDGGLAMVIATLPALPPISLACSDMVAIWVLMNSACSRITSWRSLARTRFWANSKEEVTLCSAKLTALRPTS